MKRSFLFIMLAAALSVPTLTTAQTVVKNQFTSPEMAWGFTLGGVQGTNAGNDSWGIQGRGFLQYELLTTMLTGQLGLGYAELSSPNVYNAQTGMVDFRLLFAPFSLTNLNPYIYAGIGATKQLNLNNSDFLPMVPLGAGIHTRISNGIIMEVSGGYNLSLSDKLDGIPRTNANLNPLTNAKNDGFFGFSLGLAFTIFGGYDEAAEARAKALAESAEKARIEKQLADAEAARVKAVNDAEALRVKELSEAEARRLKDLSDAEARRLAELKAREKDTVIVLAKGNTISLPGIHFASGKAILSMDSEPILDKAYNALVANPNVKIVITSHTDNVGSEKANIAISLKRAQAVRNWLVKKGIASDRMRTVGRGPAEPVASNETADGRAQNRRIEFYVEN